MKLNPIFKSHMVFAAEKCIRIYGEGSGTAEICFANMIKKIESSTDRWYVEFPPMTYGGPYQMTVNLNNECIILEDIYIGDVYLFAGQSNMQFKLHESNTPYEMYETNEKLRLFSTDRIEPGEYYTAADGWIICEKESVKNWSALAYLAGNEIVKRKENAVGVITCYQGASVIESWVPAKTFEKLNIHIPLEKKHIDHIQDIYADWNTDGKLYSYALSQVIPFSVSAVIWYQGESNTSIEESKVYARELEELIHIWRHDFKDAALPFVIVQIADYIERDDDAWHGIQKAQADIQHSVSNVKTVKSADICETNEIHPPTKDKLARRIADALFSTVSV